MKHLRKGNIAFWRYDRPGKRFLSGRIEKVSGKAYPGPDCAMIEGYGGACWFRLSFCLPYAEGMKVAAAMKVATMRHDSAVEEATSVYNQRMSQLLPKGIKL